MEYSSFYVSFSWSYKIVVFDVAFAFEMVDVEVVVFVDEIGQVQN